MLARRPADRQGSPRVTQELAGKTVVITGAGQGLGRAYAVEYARLGAKIVVAELSEERAQATEQAIKEIGGESLAVVTDVANEESVRAAFDATVERFGRIDGLVNNAGVYDGLKPVPSADLDAQRWERVMRVNVWGTFVCAREAYARMKVNGAGRIVNVSSSTALMGTPMMSDYVASKGAVIALTKSLAREYGPDGITVNTVAPGGTWTEASEHLFGNGDDTVLDPEKVRAASIAQQAIRRQQYPTDLLGLVRFLLSDASEMLTGQLLVLDGGIVLH